MGWLWLGIIGLGALLLLRALGVARAWLQLSAAALLVGAAGYAMHENAGLSGRPVETRAAATGQNPGLVAFRAAIMPASSANRAALEAADRLSGEGDPTGAAQAVLAALKSRSQDATLWTRLGSLLAEHDGGQVSPSALYAFRRAIQAAPREPGPPFFLGLALIQAGDLPAAREAWLQSLALTPAAAPYREDIAQRVLLVDRVLAIQAEAERAAPPL